MNSLLYRSAPLAELRLAVWDFNETAMRLYQETGYQPRSRTLTKALT